MKFLKGLLKVFIFLAVVSIIMDILPMIAGAVIGILLVIIDHLFEVLELIIFLILLKLVIGKLFGGRA